jgi:hypothetical protein
MTFSSAGINHLNARGAVAPRWLLWIGAKNFTTLTDASIGLWNGDDDLTFTIDGGSRVYNGALGKFDVEPLVYAKGTDIRTQRITLSVNTPEVEDVFRGFIVKGAAVELHLALMDPQSGAVIDTDRKFKGFLNRAPISTPAMGSGGGTISLEMVSSMRLLTRTIAVKKTDQSQQLRSGDRFRRYGAVAAEVDTEWSRE